ncbi:MAG: hypothetical protein E7L17_06635 [Clostridium sp.]|uniref:hypothetical protein n=1 Tax=Clostridium sp. TaxID=1506 RepID=UPI002908D296|nr:hypothetical protein [Clostridium sp.]MDU7337774.1 hypothetical protein [Clostridium sp.]
MNSDQLNNMSYWDQIRTTQGDEACKTTFIEHAKKDVRQAVSQLNDNRLAFPCLYILHEPILQQHAQRYLNMRNMTALQLINQVKGYKAVGINTFSAKQKSSYPVLKWILETGFKEEILEDDYEEVLDLSISVLINIHKDADILPMAADILFQRNRNDRLIHDLVWALFRFRDPQVLKLIAQRLSSANQKDANLAAELLHTDLIEKSALKSGKKEALEAYLDWLEENLPYLYFTEESFQYTSKPEFCTLDLERKYLQKGTPSLNKVPITTLAPEEQQCMAAFQKLSKDEKRLLSNYSHRIHNKSISDWEEWLHVPTHEQIKAAKARLEGEE